VLRGQHNVAGEYGHLPLSLDGPPCACGSRGCWEAYVSNLATISRYVGRPFPPSQPIPRELASMNVLDVVGQARAGDTRALTALGTTGRYLGLGLAMIVKSLDPGRICIGGEITAAWDLIEPAVREGLAERGLIAADTEIVMVPSDEHLRLKGASALVGRPPTRVLPSLGRRPPPARPIPSGSGRRRAHASPRAARVDSGQRNAHRLGRPRPGARFRSAHVRRASLHGEIVLAKGYGVRQLGQRDSVDADTRFMIASNTKPLTTLMLAKLVDAGKFNWDTPVTEVMPTFTLASAQATKELRMRHLVCACTGLPRQDMEWIFEGERLTPASVLELVATMEPNSPIGALYQYSNLMAGAAGYIGGQVQHPGVETGAAYDAAMQELVFGPLGMGSTTFDVSAALRGNHARPHALDLDGHMVEVDLDVLSVDQLSRPDGGAWSTVNDLLRYLRMELDYGRLPDGSRYIGTAPLLARASAASLPGATGWVMASGSRSTQAPAPRCCTTGVRRRASSRTWSGGPNTTSAQSS
jgi:CubicO group peptidase (beta-lactamase class C family)